MMARAERGFFFKVQDTFFPDVKGRENSELAQEAAGVHQARLSTSVQFDLHEIALGGASFSCTTDCKTPEARVRPRTVTEGSRA